MLIKLGTTIFNTSDIRIITPSGETPGHYVLHLSTEPDGRRIKIPAELYDRLETFLRATGLVDLNGAAYQEAAFKRAGELNEELHARQAIKNVFELTAQRNAADQVLNNLAAAVTQTPTTPQTPSVPPLAAPTPPANPAGLSVVPPALPNLDEGDPDPMTFVARNPRRYPSQFSDL